MLVLATSACGLVGGLRVRRTWLSPVGGEVQSRSRRWPRNVPVVSSVFDIEHYRLRTGSKVLFFRNSLSLEEASVELRAALRSAGWTLTMSRGSAMTRSFSGCSDDCAEGRFYATVELERNGSVSTTMRMATAGEFGRRVPLPGSCEPLPLARPGTADASSRFGPVFTTDLDRDGSLDGFAPRLSVPKDGEDAPEVVWDIVVTRGNCGHVVGTLWGVPIDTEFAPLGPRGLANLILVSRREVDGKRRRVIEELKFNGKRYEITAQYGA